MIVKYADTFDKSVRKITDKIALKRLLVLTEKLKEAKNLGGIPNVKAISGNIALYRIRTGDYRLIVEYWAGEITILLIEYVKKNEKTYLKYR